jgi:hypothetical protein
MLWWLSTAEEELLEDCVIDRNRYAIVGMTVMGTWLFATLAWTYFFSTVTHQPVIVIMGGLFMGALILSIDRSLIKGINRANRKKIIPLGFRALLALTIGLFMAQPALLFLFDKEIHVQISLDNEQRKQDKQLKQLAVYGPQTQSLTAQRNKLLKELDDRYLELSLARENYIKETDGTGGSKKIGLKDIALAKQREYEKLDKAYREKESQMLPAIKKIDTAIVAIDQSIEKEQQAFTQLLNDGFVTRIEALTQMIKNNNAVAFRYYLLVMILLLIELMPVIAKSLLPSGPYDEKVTLREALEIELTQNNHRRELALKELYNQTAFEKDTDFIKEFFTESEADRKSKMKEQFENWRTNSDKSFDTVWGDMKEQLLTKEEN